MALAVHALQEQINAAKLNLKAVDENIKKITGKDPNAPRVPSESEDTRRTVLGRRQSGGLRRHIDNDEPPKKRPGNVFRRLSRSGPNQGGDLRQVVSRLKKPTSDEEEEEEEPEVMKPSIQSSVVSTAKKITKTEVINAQNVDERGKARNRRMFGMLLGTLSRFQDDQKRPSPQMKQAKLQKQIEVRLEEESAENRKKVIEERRMLFNERRMQRKKIELLEMKVALASEQEEWKQLWEMKKGFIMTKAKPEVFYLPKEHNEKSKELVQESEGSVQERIQQHEKSVLENIEKIDAEIANITDRLAGKTPQEHNEHKRKKKQEQPMDEDEEEVDLNKIPTDEIKVEQHSQSDDDEMEKENVDVENHQKPNIVKESENDIDEQKTTEEEVISEDTNGHQEDKQSSDEQMDVEKQVEKPSSSSSSPVSKSNKTNKVIKQEESESDASSSSSSDDGSSSSNSSSSSSESEEEKKPQKTRKSSSSSDREQRKQSTRRRK